MDNKSVSQCGNVYPIIDRDLITQELREFLIDNGPDKLLSCLSAACEIIAEDLIFVGEGDPDAWTQWAGSIRSFHEKERTRLRSPLTSD
jgi:hypothetical protein